MGRDISVAVSMFISTADFVCFVGPLLSTHVLLHRWRGELGILVSRSLLGK